MGSRPSHTHMALGVRRHLLVSQLGRRGWVLLGLCQSLDSCGSQKQCDLGQATHQGLVPRPSSGSPGSW